MARVRPQRQAWRCRHAALMPGLSEKDWHACCLARALLQHRALPTAPPPGPAQPPPRTPLARPAGHETTFAALLYCLAKLGVVGQADAQALVTRVFHRYLQLMRKIQVGRAGEWEQAPPFGRSTACIRRRSWLC